MNKKVIIAVTVLVVAFAAGLFLMKGKNAASPAVVAPPATPLPAPTPATPMPSPPQMVPQPQPEKPITKGKCFVGGCSGQMCSDREDMMSTCEYREEYACYKSATCERQATGECGWTETPELSSCLSNSGSSVVY